MSIQLEDLIEEFVDRYANDAYSGDELQMVRRVIEDAMRAAYILGRQSK